MTGAAVKVTEVPAQTAPGGVAVMLMLTGRFGLTVMLIGFEVAGVPVAHVAFDERILVMISPFIGV